MDNLRTIKADKVAVFRALQLGDMLCAIPAIRAVKNAFPDIKLTLIGLPWAEEFAARFRHYFSGFIAFPGYPGLPEQPYNARDFRAFMHTVAEENFDLIVQMQGNGKVINPMIESLGSQYIAGFYTGESYKPDSPLFIPYPEDISEIERYILLAKHLGAPSGSRHLEFPVFAEEEAAFSNLALRHDLHLNYYAVVHPGASEESKRWPVKNFAQVGRALLSMGYQVVLTGTKSETPVGKELEQLISMPVINLVGQTSLAELASLIQDAEILISNDTGVSHMASAVNTRSLILFQTTDPVRWGPLDRDLHHIVLPDEVTSVDFVIRSMEKVLATRL